MLKRTIICKIPILIELSSAVVASSQNDRSDISGIVRSLNDEFCEVIEQQGFKSISEGPRHVSQRNGGYSLYQSYLYEEGIFRIKLILDVRVADHASKPSLEVRNVTRTEALSERFSEIESGDAELILIDTYCKEQGIDVNIFISNNQGYSKPVKSFEEATKIIRNKVAKVISTRLLSASESILSKYSKETIEFVEAYLSDVTDLTVYELSNSDWQEKLIDNEVKDTRLSYLETGFDEGLFNSISEFDLICNAILVREKYAQS